MKVWKFEGQKQNKRKKNGNLQYKNGWRIRRDIYIHTHTHIHPNTHTQIQNWLLNILKYIWLHSQLEKCKLKLLWVIFTHRSNWWKFKSLLINSVCKSMGKQKLSDIVEGKANWYNFYSEIFVNIYWNSIGIYLWISNSSFRNLPQEYTFICMKNCAHRYILKAIIINR